MVSDVEREVLGEIERVVGRAVGRDEDLVADVGLDSMTLTSLAVELEDRYRIRLTGREPPRTVADLVRLVELAR